MSNHNILWDKSLILYQNYLELAANWAAIFTALIAAFAYGKYIIDRRIKKSKLEQHLRHEKLMNHDEGKRTILHLMANLSMTEAEILSAAFTSQKVSSAVSTDDRGRASMLLFEYVGNDIDVKTPF